MGRERKFINRKNKNYSYLFVFIRFYSTLFVSISLFHFSEKVYSILFAGNFLQPYFYNYYLYFK
jgi:hypothetical protein